MRVINSQKQIGQQIAVLFVIANEKRQNIIRLHQIYAILSTESGQSKLVPQANQHELINQLYNIRIVLSYCLLYFLFYFKAMSNDAHSPSPDQLTSLIKIIREREQLYFSLLNFISKNIESSSNKLDQIGLFNRFLSQIKNQQNVLKGQQEQLCDLFWINKEQPYENFHVRKNSKQIFRLTSRLMEMLQTSLEKSTHSIFNNEGALSLEFLRFQKLIHRITAAEFINIKTYVTTLLNYSINKFNRQIFKIEKYLFKIESGEHISLRDMFTKDGSDVSCPEDDPKESTQRQNKKIDQPPLQVKENTKSGQVRKSFKKGSSNRLSLTKKKPFKKEGPKDSQQKSSQNLNQKSKTASKLLKYYHLLQLNKKQFMEDYVFQQEEKEQRKAKLLSALLEKNKLINGQINEYQEKSKNYLKTIASCTNIHLHLNRNNTDTENEGRQTMSKNQSGSGFKISLRKSFIISKRKSSFNLDNPASSQKSENEGSCAVFANTIKDFVSKRKLTQSVSKSHNKTHRMYIVKAPMLFEEQIIPQVEMNNPGRRQVNHSIQKGKEKKNDHVRMRKRNNPVPMEKSSFLETFRYEAQSK